LAVATVAVFATAVVAQPPGTPDAVPGVCTGSTSAGVGCSYDVTKVDAFDLVVNPKRPVIQWAWCDPSCYERAHWYDPDCEYCQYQLPTYNITYSVPSNVFVLPTTEAGGCFEQNTQETVDQYETLVGHTEGHSGWFHSWSKTTVNFYSMYYKYDASQALQYKFLIWHSLVVPAFPTPATTLPFKISVSGLPASYDNASYTAFLDEWGTHYMSSAQVGGSALMTQYFHSCFTQQYGGSYTSQQSSSSFFGIFGHHSDTAGGNNKTDGNFKQYSNTTIKLLGGAADKYGDLNWTNTMDAAQVQDWEDSIKTNMVPLTFSFTPLHSLIADAAVASNVKRALVEYGADVATYTQSLVNHLIPQDPHFRPPWCKFDPHPPVMAAMAAAAGGESGEIGVGDGLPGCPALPSPTDDVVVSEGKRRAMGVAPRLARTH